MLRLFHISHDGCALGGISIVFAESEGEAREMVLLQLQERKLLPIIYDVVEIEIKHGAVMLWDGDY